MANTYTLIEAKTLGSSTASITFSSIPQTYTDLKLVASTRNNNADTDNNGTISFNSSTSSRSAIFVYGTGSSALSGTDTGGFTWGEVGNNATSNTFSNFEIYIPNYTSSNYKSYSNDGVTEQNATRSVQMLVAGLWSNTAAITSITLTPQSYSYLASSTFYLYGIKNS